MAKPFPRLSGKLVLAPMHNTTNVAFRLLCKKYGASLVSTELISANAIVKNQEAIFNLVKTCEKERPLSIQIFSESTKNIVEAAKLIPEEFDIIDINFGCSSKRILSQGSGGGLLKEKNKIYEIVSGVSKVISLPLTVKIRSGFDKDSINAVEIAKICEMGGVSAIIIHARTVKQGYSGKADWKIIKKIKESVNIPVIGNGDVFLPQDAEKMLKETKCDYVMVGRGAIGNPFIFKQINEYLKSGKIISQTKKEKLKDYFEYIKLTKKFGIFSIKDAKLRAQEFTKGLPGSVILRRELNSLKNFEEIEKNILGLIN